MIGIELTQAGGALRAFRSGSGPAPNAHRTVADEVVCVIKRNRIDGGADFHVVYFDGTTLEPDAGEYLTFWFCFTKVMAEKMPAPAKAYFETIVGEVKRAFKSLGSGG